MKYLLLLLLLIFIATPCFADIELINPPNQNFVKIANKYSPFYKEKIKVYFVDSFEDNEEFGEMRLYSDGHKEIWVVKEGYNTDCSGYCFDFVLNHEIAHWYWLEKTEEECTSFSFEMMRYLSNFI